MDCQDCTCVGALSQAPSDVPSLTNHHNTLRLRPGSALRVTAAQSADHPGNGRHRALLQSGGRSGRGERQLAQAGGGGPSDSLCHSGRCDRHDRQCRLPAVRRCPSPTAAPTPPHGQPPPLASRLYVCTRHHGLVQPQGWRWLRERRSGPVTPVRMGLDPHPCPPPSRPHGRRRPAGATAHRSCSRPAPTQLPSWWPRCAASWSGSTSSYTSSPSRPGAGPCGWPSPRPPPPFWAHKGCSGRHACATPPLPCARRRPHRRYRAEAGDVVVGRVTEVAGKRWKVELASTQDASLMLSSVNLPGMLTRKGGGAGGAHPACPVEAHPEGRARLPVEEGRPRLRVTNRRHAPPRPGARRQRAAAAQRRG